jgi:soluble lytic murein transglycosylase-like protein
MQFPAAADILAHGTGGSMRIAPTGGVRKAYEFTVMGTLVLLVMSGEGLQAPVTTTERAVLTDGVMLTLSPAADTAADTAAAVPTLLDSLRAESRLPAVALRRPLERYLGRFSDDRLLVRRISLAVLRESRRQQVPPSLITAVLLTENTTLRPDAESSVGAQGLMQVMPFHAGARLCNSADLVDVDSNICHGTLILARNLRATNTSAAALLRYNGCVRGTNTPDCWRYPNKVLARASVVRREILASNGVMTADQVPSRPVQLAAR